MFLYHVIIVIKFGKIMNILKQKIFVALKKITVLFLTVFVRLMVPLLRMYITLKTTSKHSVKLLLILAISATTMYLMSCKSTHTFTINAESIEKPQIHYGDSTNVTYPSF